MSNFEFNREQIKSQEAELVKINTDLASSMMHLWLPILNLRLYCFLKGSSLDQKLTDTYNYLKNQRKNIFYLKSNLGEIRNDIQCGEKYAKNIIDKRNFIKDAPYDKKGIYGGDQGSPERHSKELIDIVKRYYPKMKDKDIEKYLKKLNSEGCGYVACINTVFSKYMNREKEFLKRFGFPMYKMDGSINYEVLITDFYAATDNHNLINGNDVISIDEDKSAVIGKGTTPKDREYRFEKYMRDHGIEVDIKNDIKVTPENFELINQSKDVIIRTRPVRLVDSNGKKIVENGGHAMTITNVTSDGKYEVSSWGEKYYLDPSEKYEYLEFQTVDYK